MWPYPKMRKTDSREVILRACRKMESGGEPITLQALAKLVGMKRNSVGMAVKRLQSLGRFPHSVADPRFRRDALWRRAAGAAQGLQDRGLPITYEAIGSEIGANPHRISVAAGKARKMGLWPFHVVPVTVDERTRRAVVARNEARSRRARDGEEKQEAEPDEAAIRLIEAKILRERKRKTRRYLKGQIDPAPRPDWEDDARVFRCHCREGHDQQGYAP